MIDRAIIIPTGNEIAKGIVTDTNSPAIMEIILENFPGCEITRLKPCLDIQKEIVQTLDKCVSNNANLIILIGGSGGGHRFVPTLGKDYTHSSLMEYIPKAAYREIYGPNGHLWSKLVVGKKDESLIVNVPGPYAEAVAAAKACIRLLKEGIEDENILVEKIADAVFMQYPTNKD